MRQIAPAFVLLSVVTLMGYAQSTARDLTATLQPGSRTIRGRVFRAGTDEPLRNARVQATPPNQPVPPAFTDADGRFVVSVAADGSSRLSITKPGYLPTMFAVPRTEGDLELRLARASAISGRITDTSGDPVIGMVVTAERPRTAASARTVVATGQTDDVGDYRLGGLPEGRYLVSVNSIAPEIGETGAVVNELKDGSLVVPAANGRPVKDDGLQQMQRRVYYPGVQARGEASVIALSAGEERRAMDFSAPAQTPVDLRGGVGSIVVPLGVLGRSGTGVIRGRVSGTDGRVLPYTIVRLEVDGPGSNIFPAAVTDVEGRYEFQRLGARTYTVTATRAGFLTTAYGQRRPSDSAAVIVLQSEERREGIDITLPHPSTMTGRVVDEAGEPVEAADVRLLHIQYREGRRRLVDAGGQGTHRTDDRGMYRIYGLPPGEYIVSAHPGQVVTGQPAADLRGLTTSYFPGSANPREARQMAVDVAQEVSEVDVALVHAPMAGISGTIVDAAGHPLDSGLILTRSQRSGALAADAIDARIDPDGHFAFPNVTPGEYVIQASKGGDAPNDEGESAAQFVVVGNRDITDLTIRLSRGSTLKGRITLEGTSSPGAYFALNLQAVPVDTDRTPQNLETPASARIQSDGSFDMAGLSGPRVLRLAEGANDWTLKAVRLNGQDVTDIPLRFGTANQSIDGLDVVLTDRVSEVTGHAVDARERGVADATVIVFPVDRTLWGQASRFVASVRAAKDGAFGLRNLPPGYYYAAAVTQLTAGEWRDPDLLDALVPSATPLTIIEGDAVTATLRAVTR